MPAMLLPLLALAPLAVASAGGAAAAASTLPAAVWPAPRSAHCAPGAGPALSKVLALKLTGAGAGSAIAANATARYLPLLTEHAAPSGGVASATIAVADANETLGQGTDYSYTIKVVGNTITATAASPYGVAYALETLSQFLDATGRLQCTALAVDDAPAFVHRGAEKRLFKRSLLKRSFYQDRLWANIEKAIIMKKGAVFCRHHD
jgi:N-acetyl-beta-hexosaminidase